MSASEIEDTGVSQPRISEIRALRDFRLWLVWAAGSRPGHTDSVDLAPVINTYKLYRPLRNNDELFQTARLVDSGNVVEWGDGSIGMSAELIEDIANESMTPHDFAGFLRRNDLTQEAAAALLGYSRRQIGNFVSVGPIPRVVALACYGYEARSGTQKEQQPETSPSIHEQLAKETHAMLSQIAQHFGEQLREMRSDMRREIEATRDEIRQSIIGLPQETAESAAHMRRVLIDQIEALAELNRIVARHSRNLDIVEPTRVETAEAPPLREPPSLREPSPLREPPPLREMPPLRDLPPLRDMPPLRDVSREARVPPTQKAKGIALPGGWLSDLLNRASNNDTPSRETTGREPPAHVVESLDSIAVDIARIVDHDAAAELWDRYKRGERNVFTRMLNTMPGQRAFEEIRRRYRSDRNFVQTVDRYIAEFEHLLDEVSHDDRGQMVARTYLTSETGKLYTMLAHAVGRFAG